MNFLRFFRHALVLVALSKSLAGFAQTLDGPVGVAVTVKAFNLDWGSTGIGTVDLTVDDLNGQPSATALAYDSETPQLTARLEPGKTYFLNISSEDLGNITIQAVPPPGYVMEIERIARERVRISAGISSVRLRVRAPFQEYSGRAGTATGLTSGRIFWQAALGALSNGGSAGSLAIIDTGTGTTNWADLFSPSGFAYEHTSSEVIVVYNTDDNSDAPYVPGTIRQIIAPEACADVVVTSATQAEIKFYHRAQLLPGSGIRSFSGMPFAWYFINQDGSQPNRAYINCDLRDITDLHATNFPVVKTKHTVLERTGTAPNFTWTADEWYDDGSSVVSRDVRARSSGVESITVSEPNVATATQGSRTYSNMPWGEEITAETRGTSNAVTTSYSFYTSSDQAGNYGRPSTMTMTGDAWEAYEYYDYASSDGDKVAGALYKRHRPFKNSDTSVPPNLGQHGGEVTTFEYADDAFGRRARPSLVETAVNGVVTARSSTSYSDASADFMGRPSLRLVTATRHDSTSSSDTLTTVIKYFRENAGASATYATDDFYRMQLHSIQLPDGRKQAFVYQRGTWNGGSSFSLSANGGADYGAASRISIINGTTGSGSSYTSHDGYDVEDLNLVENKSTMEVTIRDQFARIRRTESHVWSSGGWHLLTAVDYAYNYANQLVSRTRSNGGLYEAAWSGERKLWEKDEFGIKTIFADYDAAGRVKLATRESGGAISAVSTRYSYDAAHRITEWREGWGQSENLVTTRTYDNAGRLVTETPPGLGATTFSYNPSNRTRTITLPDSSTRTETFFVDGQLVSLTGSAVVEEHYTYEIQSGGVRFARVNVGSSASSRLREIWSDQLGRITKTSRPGWTGQPSFIEENFYDSGTGRLFKSTATGYAPTRYSYDALGQLVSSGLDLDDNGLNPNSSDRITETETRFENADSAWWLRQETKIYPYGNGTAVTASVVRTRLTGHPANRLEETRTIDAEGNVVTRVVDIDRNNKTATITTSQPGLNNETRTLVNGLATSATGIDGLTFSTQYDALLRTSSVTDPRIGATTTTYHSGSTLPSTVSAAAGLLYTCGYDSLGRKTRQTDANGKNVRSAYNSRGQVIRQWGDAAHPVEYAYDSTFGDRTELKTYRSAPAADSEQWPAVGSADTTTFTTDAATGLLWKKTDAGGKFVEFSYNQRGQTHQRFWARTTGGNRVTATYGYDGNTGELTGISYNDGTPSVSYTYTRLGQLNTATDFTGQRTLGYDSNKPWRLASTTLPAFYGGRVLTALYDESGVVGRSRGFQLGASLSSAADLEQAYGFTTGGRFETLASKRVNNSVSRTFRYGYLGNSALVNNLSIDGGHAFAVARGYESNRDLLASVDSKWNSTSITRFDYTHNSLYQRDSAKQSGNVVEQSSQPLGDYGEPVFSRYTYNPRGELTGAPSYLGSNVNDTSRALPGRQHEYDYDSIGNRKSSNRTGVPGLKESYFGDDNATQQGANALNQYKRKENDSVAVQGTVDAAGTTVAVSGAPVAPARQGRFWAAEAVVANASTPWSGNLTTYAAKVGGGGGGADLVRTEVRAGQIAAQLQSFSYDDDGNLTSDGVWDYQWDAENRLIRMATTGAAVTGGFPNRVLEFRYDYLGRRVQKRVLDGGTTAEISSRRYLYVGWSLAAEYEAPNGTSLGTIVRSYTWGLDLAGSLSATGGVGALLQIHDYAVSKTLLPTYDGNGNVASLINADNGTVEAAYQYSPFGELIRAEGSYAKTNPFRFSTKWQDEETGLIYYGYRYYSASMGRFVNRDPIEEAGGFNLYGFAGNDGVNRWDYLGLNFDDYDWDPWGRWHRWDWNWTFWGEWDPWSEDFGGPDFPSRSPGITAPAGALPRRSFESIARRNHSPYDARRVVYFNNADAPNSEMTITAARDGGFWDTEGGVAHLRGIRDRLGEMGGAVIYIISHPLDTIEGIRNPVVEERLTPYGSDIDHFIIKTKMKLRGPYGRGEIMADVITLRLGRVLIFLKRGAQAAKVLGVSERLGEFYRRLGLQGRAATAEEALRRLRATMDEVEDAFSGVPKKSPPPAPGMPDGRMYPPLDDFVTRNADGSISAVTKGHKIEIGADGSIRIINKRTGAIDFEN